MLMKEDAIKLELNGEEERKWRTGRFYCESEANKEYRLMEPLVIVYYGASDKGKADEDSSSLCANICCKGWRTEKFHKGLNKSRKIKSICTLMCSNFSTKVEKGRGGEKYAGKYGSGLKKN